jgi:hypothetical protein
MIAGALITDTACEPGHVICGGSATGVGFAGEAHPAARRTVHRTTETRGTAEFVGCKLRPELRYGLIIAYPLRPAGGI